jgi:LysR family transcriptional regulator, benzoate and cis,cis-muconate-responsive activator of ben and cat genes
MQALEHEIGGALLERMASGVAPTAAGHALARRILPVLAEFEAAVSETRRFARGQNSQIRVGYMRAVATMVLNPALAVLRKTHPAVKVELFDLTQGEQITALRHGDIDVGLVGQEAAVLTREFYWRRIARLPLVVAVPENHRLAEERQVRMTELRDEMFIGAAEQAVPGRNRWVAKLCRRAGFRPRFVRYGESLANTLSHIVSEQAIAIVPEYVRQIPTPGVAVRPIVDAGATWDFLVVWQRGPTPPPMRAFLGALTVPDLKRPHE